MLSSCTSQIQKLQNRVFSVLIVLYSNYKIVVLQRYSYGFGLWFGVRAYEIQNGEGFPFFFLYSRGFGTRVGLG